MIYILAFITFLLPVTSTLQAQDKFVVVIDASHGGNDRGARNDAHGLIESKLSLQITEMLSDQFDNQYNIILTRTSDEKMTAEDRISFVNTKNPDLYISIHFGHQSDNSEFGMYSYFGPQEKLMEDSEYYAGFFLEEFLEMDDMLPVQQPSSIPDPVLSKINAPGVQLSLGSFGNTKFNEYLTKPKNLAEISYLIASAIRGIKNDE